MKILHSLMLSALLLTPFTAAQALDVQVDVCVQARQVNTCKIKQDGTHNYARSHQAGEDNLTEIEQRGRENDAGVTQDGLFNEAEVVQTERRRRR